MWKCAQELCERRGGCPGLPVPDSPYGLSDSGRKATLKRMERGALAYYYCHRATLFMAFPFVVVSVKEIHGGMHTGTYEHA